jgi:hypothetical protein
MLIKLTSRVDFTNILQAAFALLHMQIPEVKKDTDDLTVLLRFWDLNTKKLFENILVKLTSRFV